MLLLLLLLAHVTFGSSLSLLEHLCYGGTYYLPVHFTPALYNQTITYTPQVGESKIVVNHGQSLDSRFKVSRGKIAMTHLSERENEATLSIKDSLFDSVILRIKNCQSILKKFCGSSIIWKIPYDAEYLEFSSPHALAPPAILWNRTNRSSTRGKVSGSDYVIKDITQRDSGYYRFRGSKDQLLKWEEIVVEENVRHYEFDEGDIKLDYPIVFTPSQVKFKGRGAYNGKTVSEDDGKFKITNRYLAIEYATPEDGGTYDFLDKDGNLILRMTLEVREVEKVWVSLVVLAAIFLGFVSCCCCVKKCCCKESADKTNCPESETEAAAPSNTQATQTPEPVTPLLSQEPRVIFPAPPTYNEAGGHLDPPPPYEECGTQSPALTVPTYSCEPNNPPVSAEPTMSSSEPAGTDDVSNDANNAVMVDGGQPDQVSAAGAMTFTDSEPQFELRGLTLPSAPPLSSNDSVEYTSDKLNFL